MIKRERSALRVTCDNCGQFKQDAGYRRNDVAWKEAQAAGWIAKPIKDGKDFRHLCPECVEA